MRVLIHYLGWVIGLAGPETQTTEAERECLVRYASGRRRLVEIGVWHGLTTSRLRSVMATDGVLSAVDPFPPGRLGFSAQKQIAHYEVGRIRNGTVRWLETDGAEAAVGHEPVDFIFIDGDHSEQGVASRLACLERARAARRDRGHPRQSVDTRVARSTMRVA